MSIGEWHEGQGTVQLIQQRVILCVAVCVTTAMI